MRPCDRFPDPLDLAAHFSADSVLGCPGPFGSWPPPEQTPTRLAEFGSKEIERHQKTATLSLFGGAPVLPCQADLTGDCCQANLTTVRNDVRKLREDRSLSQGDLARHLNVSRQTVNAIETGRYLPSLPLALAIGRYFGKAIEEVFHDDEHE